MATEGFKPFPLPRGTFGTVLYTPELEEHTACGVPTKVSTDDWMGKNVVIFAVPGAFTPTCHVNHLPPYLQKYEDFKAKSIDVIACIAANDPFVLSGWGRVNGVKDEITFLSDPNGQWSKTLGFDLDLSEKGLGKRTSRYAVIVNKEGNVVYAEAEKNPSAVEISGADQVLRKLEDPEVKKYL